MGATSSIFPHGRAAGMTTAEEELFLDKALKEGVHTLISEPNARASFAEYIKSGLWVLKLQDYELSQHGVKASMMEATSDVWKSFGYDVSDGVLTSRSNESEKSDKPSSLDKNGSDPNSASCDCEAPASPTRSVICEMYPANSTCFTMDQLCAIMLAALYPLYRRSRSYSYWLSNRHEKNFKAAETSVSLARGIPKPNRSNRLDTIFQMTAAYFDESELLHKLSSSKWVAECMDAIRGCRVSISIAKVAPSAHCDCARSFPIAYSNTVFNSMVKADSKGNSIAGVDYASIARSQEGHLESSARLIHALSSAKKAKLAVVSTRRGGEAFKNMVAVRPILNKAGQYKYVLGVHFDASKRRASVCQVQFMEDMLALLPMLIKTSAAQTNDNAANTGVC